MTTEDHQRITAEVLNREEFLTFQVCLNPIPLTSSYFATTKIRLYIMRTRHPENLCFD